MKRQYGFIDIAKLIFAIGIMSIHAEVFKNTNDGIIYVIYKGIFRLGVPFFFVSSGFFLYNKLKKTDNLKLTVIGYIKRLLIPLLFWVVIDFFPIKLVPAIINGESVIVFVIKIIRGIIFYPWGAMWYIHALIIAVLLIVPFYRKNKLKNVVIFGGILYLLSLLCNNYYFLIENTVIHKIVDLYLKIAISGRNGIFEGLYFVSVGMYIAELLYNKKISFTLNNFIFLIFYVLLIIEILLIKNFSYRDDGSLYVMYISLIPSLFIFLLQFNIKCNTTKIRNYSTGIYFTHYFVIKNIVLLLAVLSVELPSICVFILSLIIILVLLTILYKINNKHINMVIK